MQIAKKTINACNDHNSSIDSPSSDGGPNPRCLAVLPNNIEEIIALFENQS